MNFIWVAAGGAVGAAGRYAISMLPLKAEFPFLTLATNVIGAIMIGIVVDLAAGKNGISANEILFWKTGVCGGFTTFSTFSLESYDLLEKGYCFSGILYITLSAALCLAGIVIGKHCAAFFT